MPKKWAWNVLGVEGITNDIKQDLVILVQLLVFLNILLCTMTTQSEVYLQEVMTHAFCI